MPPFMGPLANAMGQGFAQQRPMPQQMMRPQMPMQGQGMQRPNIPRPMPRQLPPDMGQGLGPSPNAPMMGRMAQGMGQMGAALGPAGGMQRPMPPPPMPNQMAPQGNAWQGLAQAYAQNQARMPSLQPPPDQMQEQGPVQRPPMMNRGLGPRMRQQY